MVARAAIECPRAAVAGPGGYLFRGDMLLTAMLPLCDLRPLLGGEAARNALPRWSGATAGDRGFVPWFGALQARGPRSRFHGERVCGAKNAVQILSWPLQTTELPEPGPFRALHRDLTADGGALVRFDLAMGTDPSSRERLLGIAELALRFPEVQIGMVDLQGPTSPRRAGDGVTPPLPRRHRETTRLYHAGNVLARAYLVATTPVAERLHLGPDWVIAGAPVFILQWGADEAVSEEGLPPLRSIGDGAVSVAREALPAAGPRSTVWFIRHAGAARQAQETRLRIADLCARRECLRAVLQRVAEGRLSPPPNPPRGPRTTTGPLSESDQLQTYLQLAVREIDRRQRDFPVPTEQRPAPRSSRGRLDVSGSFVGRLDAAMQRLDVRGNIRRSVEAWARADSGSASAETEPVLTPPPRAARSGPDELVNVSVAGRGGELVRGIALRGLEGIGSRSFDEICYTEPAEVALPAAEVSLHARLAAVGRERVEPGDVATFLLDFQLDTPYAAPGPAGATDAMRVLLGQGEVERSIFVSASSGDFTPLPGKTWERVFTLRRDSVTPSSWSFEGKALGDRPVYRLSIQITVNGARACGLQVQLGRRNGDIPSQTSATGTMTAPASAGASVVVTVDREGPACVAKWTAAGGEPLRWTILFDPVEHFRALGSERLQERKALAEYCRKLVIDVNRDLYDALRKTALDHGGILIQSSTPMLPFELLPVAPSIPFLGAECPVARWVNRPDVPVPQVGARRLAKVACIRPDYEKSDALPDAAGEEADLRTWLEDRGLPAPVHAGDKAGVDALLSQGDIDLLHFAGHAEDQPPAMRLPGRDTIAPDLFLFSHLVDNHPLFFLNGCRAAMGHADQPPSLGGMIEGLLRLDFVGVVAPFLTVDSAAARKAARAFYEALGRGKTAVEAVQAIHACADTDPGQAATYMSYLAYVPAGLRMGLASAVARAR